MGVHRQQQDHLYCPQDKGKVERAIRNVAKKFIYLPGKFPEWLHGVIEEYHKLYNKKRYLRGIYDVSITSSVN